MSIALDQSLRELEWKLEEADAQEYEYVIFGSTALVLRGVLNREPGDIDLFVSKWLWGKWLPWEEWFVETPKAGDPPILSNEHPPIPIHAFFDWKDEAVGMDAEVLIATAETIEWKTREFRVVSVEEALRVKKQALTKGTNAVQKHVADIEAIEAYLGKQDA